jgi:outer membrane protein OmpA-like peptidoglycan-associated protein
MIDLSLPLHQGVDSYLTDQAIALRAADASIEPENKGQSFTLYFDTNDSTLGRDDIGLVAEACKVAATLTGARFIISGHTDSAGPEAYNSWLSVRRAAKVADAIRNDPRFKESLSVLEFGEQRLAIATGDGVAEAMNRRVEITVVPDS